MAVQVRAVADVNHALYSVTIRLLLYMYKGEVSEPQWLDLERIIVLATILGRSDIASYPDFGRGGRGLGTRLGVIEPA